MLFALYHRTGAESLESSWRSGSPSPTCLSCGEVSGHVPPCGLSWHRRAAFKYNTMKYFKQASERLTVSSIYRDLGEVMHELMSSMMILGGLVFMFARSRDINSRKEKGRGILVWMVCRRIEEDNR